MFNKYFEEMNIAVTDVQYALLEKYYTLLISENEKYNLTAITEKKEVFIKHFLDSMIIQNFFESYNVQTSHLKIIDIGTGGGFPGVPIKIRYPEISLVGLDALNKRINFLNILTDSLSLERCRFVHGRAEDLAREKGQRESYDIAVSRAVAELRMLLEYVMPFVKVGGYFVAYKSLKFDEELIQAERALNEMKTLYLGSMKFQLPEGFGERELMIFQKKENISNKYPRKAGTAKKSPL